MISVACVGWAKARCTRSSTCAEFAARRAHADCVERVGTAGPAACRSAIASAAFAHPTAASDAASPRLCRLPDPADDEVGDRQVVLVQHQHVGVALVARL